MITRIVSQLFYFYYILIIVRIFLTWVQTINWEQQPFGWIRSVTDPFLNIFRGIIPPIGGVLDISPILAIILLQILQGIVVGALSSLGL
ncbi:MAG: YggT family protein [Cyanobacteria bacterium SIG28]|nr:YggT family protein [Cyanobacteria bacterium SIG28]